MTDLQERLAGYDSSQICPEDAHALFAEARGHCPVGYSVERGGYYLLMDYRDVKAAHSNWQQLSTEPSIMRPLSDKPPLPPLEYHPGRTSPAGSTTSPTEANASWSPSTSGRSR
jgi:hypothetical protein